MAEKQNFIQASSSGNMEWINDLKKRELIKIERPARSPQRLNESMRKSNLMESPKRFEKSADEPQ